MSKGPILFDLEPDHGAPERDPAPNVADAPPIPDLTGPDFGPGGAAAMETAVRAAARPSSLLARWFWALAGALVGTSRPCRASRVSALVRSKCVPPAAAFQAGRMPSNKEGQ